MNLANPTRCPFHWQRTSNNQTDNASTTTTLTTLSSIPNSTCPDTSRGNQYTRGNCFDIYKYTGRVYRLCVVLSLKLRPEITLVNLAHIAGIETRLIIPRKWKRVVLTCVLWCHVVCECWVEWPWFSEGWYLKVKVVIVVNNCHWRNVI